MNIQTYRVKQYNSKNTTVICVDGIPIVSARGKKQISLIISYLSGYDVKINDGYIKRTLDKYLDRKEQINNERK